MDITEQQESADTGAKALGTQNLWLEGL